MSRLSILSGNTYVFEVRHKNHTFTPQVLSILEDYSNLNFIANEGNKKIEDEKRVREPFKP